MRFDVDELAADELEEGAREAYESQSRRNQFPQARRSQKAYEMAKDGQLPDDEEYETVVGSIAAYTMIPSPDEDDIANMSGS